MRLLAAGLLLGLAAPAFADPGTAEPEADPPAAIAALDPTKPEQWRDFDWTALEQGAAWTAAGPAGPKDQDGEFTDFRAERSAPYRLLSRLGRVMFFVDKAGGPARRITFQDAALGFGACGDVGKTFRKIYGKPTGSRFDFIEGQGPPQAVFVRDQWAVGRSALTVRCDALRVSDGVIALIRVELEPAETARPVRPVMELRCRDEVGAQRYFHSLFVDERDQTVSAENRQVMGFARFTPETLVMDTVDVDGRHTLTVNRRTGFFTATGTPEGGRGVCKYRGDTRF